MISVKLYSRCGVDMARRFPDLCDAAFTCWAVIDAELVACDTDGKPDFLALRRPHLNLCVWCFDLLAVAGQIGNCPFRQARAGCASF